jgi:acylglycerol lipase
VITLAWDIAGLRGRCWRPDRPRAAVLLQHGYAEYADRYVERYNRLIPRLVERGFAVYAFDAPGHGRSPGPRGLADVDAIVEAHRAARRSLAGRPLFLFGHSLGGLVTAASVARDPAGVTGVVLSAPALLIHANPVLRALAPLIARAAPTLGVQSPLDPSGISRDEAEVRRYATDPMLYRGPVPALLGASALAVSERTHLCYRDWRTSVLVLHGTDDLFTDPEGSRRFVDAIAAPDKRLVTVEGGRHELLNDWDRDAALAAILDWLDARAPA